MRRLAILLVSLAACGGAEPIPFSPPAISWIHPATLAGTWDYRGYSVYQAGCWHEGGGIVCRGDSTLEVFSGIMTVASPRGDSIVVPTGRLWNVPYHLEINVQQWDLFQACNGLPLSCFTNRPPTSTFSEVGDSVLEVTDEAQLPAEIVLRDGRVQFAWKTTDTIPVVFYDSVAAAPAPLVPGVHDLRKRIP